MSVTATNALSGPYTPNSSTTEFPFTFEVETAAEVGVIQGGTEIVSGFAVALNSVLPGGTVTFATAPATGSGTIYVFSKPSFQQNVTFTDTGPFLPESHDEANDRDAERAIYLKHRVDQLLPTAMLDPAVRANRYLAFDAQGVAIPSAGTGADAGLRTDLAASGGSALVGFIQSGVGSLTRTVQDKLRDTMSLADKAVPADALPGLQAVQTDFTARGGRVDIPEGGWPLSGTFTAQHHAFNIQGRGRSGCSEFVYNPAVPGTAIEFNNGPSDPGGHYSSSLKDVSFNSGNTVDKTAISVVNGANLDFVNISATAWPGDNSIGLLTAGRQFVRLSFSELSMSSPVVIDKNTVSPSLAGDYFEIHECELTSRSAVKSAIEVRTGAVLTNFSVSNTALVCGKHGYFSDDTTAGGISVNLEFRCIRVEQGLDPTGWSFQITSTVQNLQTVLFDNVLTDARRGGVKLNKTLIATFINTTFPQTSLNLAAKVVGTPVSPIVTTTDVVGATFVTGGILVGGLSFGPAVGQLALQALPTDGKKVTIGTLAGPNRDYFFKTVLTGAANEVLIGTAAQVAAGVASSTINCSAVNLRDAILAAAGDGVNTGPGISYGAGTVVHPDVTAAIAPCVDITMVPGSFLTFIGCSTGNVGGGTKKITNGRRIYAVLPATTGAAFGPEEKYDYFVPGGGGAYDYSTMRPVEQQGIQVVGYEITFPAGSTTHILPMANTGSMTVDVDFVARAANGKMVLRFQKNGTITAGSTADGAFATTATAGKIYPNISGAQLQLIANALAAATTIRVEMRQ